MQCFHSFHTAGRTLGGVEALHMMREGQVKRLGGRDSHAVSLKWPKEDERNIGAGKAHSSGPVELKLLDVPHVDLQSSRGVPLGTFYLLPLSSLDYVRKQAVFAGAINRSLLWAALAAICFALIVAAALSRRILRPVEALTVAVRRMEAGDLSQRVNDHSQDEIGELTRAFNSMADGLARSEQLPGAPRRGRLLSSY